MIQSYIYEIFYSKKFDTPPKLLITTYQNLPSIKPGKDEFRPACYKPVVWFIPESPTTYPKINTSTDKVKLIIKSVRKKFSTYLRVRNHTSNGWWSKQFHQKR